MYRRIHTIILTPYSIQDDTSKVLAARRLIIRYVADGSTPFVPVVVLLDLE